MHANVSTYARAHVHMYVCGHVWHCPGHTNQTTGYLLHGLLKMAGSCLNMRMRHPHVEDDTAQNHYELPWLLEMMLRIPMNY
jgi:hypothetical protein